MRKRIFSWMAALLLLFLTACGPATEAYVPAQTPAMEETEAQEAEVQEEAEETVSEEEREEAATEVPASEEVQEEVPASEGEPRVREDGVYDSKEEVALYIHIFGHLPSNYITKKEAEALGWEGGSVEEYAPGKCIGGSYFGNREGLLPEADGRKYTECDIDTLGASKRGAKRIVFSNDGLIYYTEDHYESFELLYGDE